MYIHVQQQTVFCIYQWYMYHITVHYVVVVAYSSSKYPWQYMYSIFYIKTRYFNTQGI